MPGDLFVRGNRKQNVQISRSWEAEQALFNDESTFLSFHLVTHGRKVLSVVDRHMSRLTAAIRRLVADVKSCCHLQILHAVRRRSDAHDDRLMHSDGILAVFERVNDVGLSRLWYAGQPALFLHEFRDCEGLRAADRL